MKRKDLQGEKEMKGEIQRDRKIKEESYRERYKTRQLEEEL